MTEETKHDATGAQTETENTAAATNTETTTESGSQPKVAGLSAGTIAAIVLGCALVGGVLWYTVGPAAGTESELSAIAPATPVVEPPQEYPEVIATVNGEDISAAELVQTYAQTAQLAATQGIDITNPAIQSEIETESITVVINTALLNQAAAAAGITITDEEFDFEYNAVLSGYPSPEAFAEVVAENGFTLEEVQDDLRNQMVITRYLDSAIDRDALAVAPAEIQAFYDEVAAQNAEVPPLENVAPQIEQQLLQQKQQEAVGVIIENLRAEAEITQNI